MANENSDRRILVDKRLVAINFDDLARIEAALFNPTVVNLLSVKKRIPIPLSKQELIQDWNHPHSFSRNLLTTFLMSEIYRCLFIEKEMFHNLMSIWGKEEELVDFLLTVKEKVEELRMSRILTQREKIESLNNLLIEAFKKPVTLHQLIAISDYILQGAKKLSLEYFLSYTKNPDQAFQITQIITDQFQRAEANTHRLQAIILDPVTPPEQRVEAEEIFERYIERYLPENIEITKQQHSDIDLDDPVTLKQYVEGARGREEFFEKVIDSIKYTPTAEEKETIMKSYREDITELPQIRSVLKTTASDNKKTPEEAKMSWKAKILQQKLNDAIGTIPAEKDIIIHGVPHILSLLKNLNTVITKPTGENKTIVDDEAELLMNTLDTNVNYQDIVALLRQWVQSPKMQLGSSPSQENKETNSSSEDSLDFKNSTR